MVYLLVEEAELERLGACVFFFYLGKRWVSHGKDGKTMGKYGKFMEIPPEMESIEWEKNRETMVTYMGNHL